MKQLMPMMLVCVLALSACGGDQAAAPAASKSAAAATTPDSAVQAQVEALRAGQFAGAFLASIPPTLQDRVRAEWKLKMAEPITDEDRAGFQQTMTELTADGAEDALYAKLEPELIKFKETSAMQMPMYLGMGRAMLAAGVQQREDFNAEQKAQAMASIDAFVKWAESAEFADSGRAKQAIGHLCQAARDLELESLDQLRSLSFDEAVKRGDIVFIAVKNILSTYGFKIDDVLATVKAETIAQTGDTAKVKVSYAMFNTPLNFETEMVKLDGRWYGKDSIEKLKKDLETPAVEQEVEAPAQG